LRRLGTGEGRKDRIGEKRKKWTEKGKIEEWFIK